MNHSINEERREHLDAVRKELSIQSYLNTLIDKDIKDTKRLKDVGMNL